VLNLAFEILLSLCATNHLRGSTTKVNKKKETEANLVRKEKKKRKRKKKTKDCHWTQKHHSNKQINSLHFIFHHLPVD